MYFLMNPSFQSQGKESVSPSGGEKHMLSSNRLIVALAIIAVTLLFAWLHSSIMFDRYKRLRRIH